MADLSTLATRFRKIADDLPNRVSKLAADTALEVVSELVSQPPSGTPVDTSQAESNWQIGIGAAPQSMLKPYFPGAGGSTQGESAEAVIEAAAEMLKRKKPGETIYISNVAPYIRRLAYEGHSKQSPPGWVEAAVLIGRMYVAKTRVRFQG